MTDEARRSNFNHHGDSYYEELSNTLDPVWIHPTDLAFILTALGTSTSFTYVGPYGFFSLDEDVWEQLANFARSINSGHTYMDHWMLSVLIQTGQLNAYLNKSRGFVNGSLAPVVLDLDGAGFTFQSLTDTRATFDATYDGIQSKIAWIKDGAALLAYDDDQDGLIAATNEISFVGYAPDAQTDLEGLAAFDTNHNGLLDIGDSQWWKFGVWRDSNGDGISQFGEFRSLDDAGIRSIGLASDGIRSYADNVTLFGRGTFTRIDGSIGQLADAAFDYLRLH